MPEIYGVGIDADEGETAAGSGREPFFGTRESEQEERLSGYAGFGFDLDEEGNHKIDSSFFYTHKQDETVQAKDDGFLPYFAYSALGDKQASGQEVTTQDYDCCATLTTWIRSVRPNTNEPPSRGPLWYTSFTESKSLSEKCSPTPNMSRITPTSASWLVRC